MKQDKPGGVTRRKFLEYGLYGGVLSGLLPGLWFAGCGRNKDPNIILITLDTTRADHLSCYGYHRRTCPNIDRLTEDSVLYTHAISPSSWTLPSHASLFTGKFSSSHGAQYDPEGPLFLTDAISGPKTWQKYRARGLAKNEITLAEILGQAGYKTGAVVGGPWMKKVFGLNKGFDYYDDQDISSVNGRLAPQINASALKWLDEVGRNKFFLFLNYFDPHSPYRPPIEYAKKFLPENTNLQGRNTILEERVALYDAEIFYMDYFIGALVASIKQNRLYENSMIIITSDHGELFGEHGKHGHGSYLFQEEIHVPLIVKYPGTEIAPDQTDIPVQLNDIMAMILTRLGLPLPAGIQAGVPPQIGHPLLAEAYPLEALSQDGHWRAFFEEDFKFLWNSKGNSLLFNLKDDPHEGKNLITQDPNRAKNMLSEMNRYLAQLPEPEPAAVAGEIDKSTIQALKGLGYVE
jgi:arylsulfatase A-like enzyme